MMLPIIKPMEPVITDHLLQKNKNWIFQIKWDGVRVLANIQRNSIQLYTRKGNDRTSVYPEIVENLGKCFKDQTLILDGEVIALEDGRPSFFKVMKRDRLKNAVKINQKLLTQPVYYVIFDILYHSDRFLTSEPLNYRFKVLENLKRQITSPTIQLSLSSDDPETLYTFTKEKGWEGIIMKELDGKYYPGAKHSTWRKIKHFKEIEVTVIGVEFYNNRARSVLLASQTEEKWKYVGKAATGLSQQELHHLTNSLDRIVLEKPFMDLRLYQDKKILWVQPVLKVLVHFLEYTPEGHLRAPVIKGFRG